MSSQSIMVRFSTARCAFQSPYLTHRRPAWTVIMAYFDGLGPILNGRHRLTRLASGHPAGSILHHRCARFRTQQQTLADPFRGSRRQMLSRHHEGDVMGKLEGKVAVITGGSIGMALASAKRFVEEGAYVFITGRRQEALDEAVKQIGRNVTAVRGDAANLDDLDRLFDTVKRVKGKIDILYASAGTGEAIKLGEITEQHF